MLVDSSTQVSSRSSSRALPMVGERICEYADRDPQLVQQAILIAQVIVLRIIGSACFPQSPFLLLSLILNV